MFSSLGYIDGLADDTLLAAAEDLERVAGIEVDGGRAPHLRVLTLAAAINGEGFAQNVHALRTKDDAGVTLGDGIARNLV